MDAEQAPSAHVDEEFDSDTKPLVGRDRGPLSRQAPVENDPQAQGARPTSPASVEGEAAVVRDTSGSGGQNGFQGTAGTEPSKMRNRRPGPGAERISVSDHYYGASVEVEGLPIDFSSTQSGKKTRTQQSRRLPYWVWFMLAKSLGIKMHPGDKPWFGTAMHALTMAFAAGFAITHTWYKVYDIVSNETKETVLSGSVSIVLVLYWCSLGIYANKLSGRLFMTPKFLESVRLHSKTIFKVSAAGMMVLLGVAEIILNAVATRNIFNDPTFCNQVKLNVALCQALYILRIGCSILTVVWNLLVGIILLSVCRTHTIGLRRFIRELEDDGRIYEICRRNMTLQGPLSGPPMDGDYDSTDDDHYPWDDVLSPNGDEGIYPKVLAFNNTATSPCHTPTRKSSRHTSQASAATSSTALLPEAVSNSNNTQVFSTVHSQYFPPNPNFPNYACSPRLNANNLNTLTVEAEVLSAQNAAPGPTTQAANSAQAFNFNSAVQRASNTEASSNRGEVFENNASSSHSVERQWKSNESDPETTKTNIPSVPDTNLPIDGGNPSNRSPVVAAQHSRPIIIIREGSVATADDSVEPVSAEQQANNQNLISADPPSFASRSTRSGCESPHQSTRVELGSPRRAPSTVTGVTEGSRSDDNLSLGLHMLTTDEILLSYWKIGTRLRSTSLALQRWLCALMMYIILWSLTFIIWWVNHSATLIGIVEFLVPILILPLICSAYGEVNFEGQRMLKCICPTQERMNMLFFITQNPLQLTAFGFVINYGLIVGALGALGLAFASRLILDEINKS